MRLRIWHAWIAVLLVGAALSSTKPSVAAEIAPTRFVMPNGLTVLVLEQRTLPIVQIHALVKAGSAQDPPEKAGLANLTASLLDEGTATRSAKQIAEQIDFIGGSLTSRATQDFTTVSARVLKKDVELGFELLADVLLHPAFPEQELERVRSQILGEILSENDDPGQVAAKAFDQVVFEGHPYRWPVNGTEPTLPKIKRADLLQFFSHEYVPNQTIVTIVGDITVDQARTLLAKRFGGWKRGESVSRTAATPHTIEKPVIKLIEKDLTQATILLGHVGISRTNPDYYAVTVMNYILGAGGFSSRLMDSIRDNQGLAYSVGSHFETTLMPGAFLVSLQTRNEAANQAISGVIAELNRIRDASVSDQELADAKAYLIGSFPLRLDTTSKLADVLGLIELYGLGLDYFTKYPKLIEQVTKEDVQRVAKQYLHPNQYALVVVANLSKAKVKQ
jgi:zinc protease